MIIIELYVPATDTSYDFELDENVKIKHIVEELCEMLSKKMKNPLPVNMDYFMLCTRRDQKILSAESTLYENGVKDGDKLFLV